jgi:hypothetical protein
MKMTEWEDNISLTFNTNEREIMQELLGISDKRYACNQEADIKTDFKNSVDVD